MNDYGVKMKKVLSVLSGAAILMLTHNAVAATSVIEWESADDYRDVRTANGSRQSFKAKVFKELEAHFSVLAKGLPATNTLKINVTNVDLAGNIEFIDMRQIRVVKEIFMPQMSFSYQLLDESGKLLKQDSVDVKDTNFMRRGNLRNDHDALKYEKNMLTRWFNVTFEQ